MISKAERQARAKLSLNGRNPENNFAGIRTGSDLHLCEMLLADIDSLRVSLRGVITPALLGLINEGDDEPKAMADEAAVDVTGNGFKCQITVGDIRKAAAAMNEDT